MLREFAEREGLSLRTLSWWRWRLAHDSKEPAATAPSTALVPIEVPFVELKAEEVPMVTPFEIVLGNGRVVRVPPAFNDSSLSRLLVITDGGA